MPKARARQALVIDIARTAFRELKSCERVWGAHACSVLAMAFCHRELRQLFIHLLRMNLSKEKFVAAKCGDQHVASVRSPEPNVAKRGTCGARHCGCI